MSGAPNFKSPPRVIADREGWEQFRRLKLAGCRLCNSTSFRVQLHHLVPRGRLGLGGGDDLPANLVPLCPEHHGKVERWDIPTRTRLRATLTEAEVGYCVAKKNADWLDHAYPSGPETQAGQGTPTDGASGLGDDSTTSPSGPEHPPEQSSFAAMVPESARALPENLTHCVGCGLAFPKPVTNWDDFFINVEDAAFNCELCAEADV